LKPLFKLYQLFNPSSSVNAETLNTSVKKFTYDNSKILSAGFTFTDIESIVAETCMVYKSSEKI
jgi:hypothetical protein